MRKAAFTYKFVCIVFLTVILVGGASSTYLVNSGDWKDVYSASYQAHTEGETPYFTRSSNLGVFEILPYGEEVNVVESSEQPIVTDIDAQVSSRGYELGNVTRVENGNLELAPDDTSLVVVPEDYPSAAVVAAPYARITGSWVLIVNNENMAQVEQMMSDAPRSVMVGEFSRDISEALSDNADEKILSPNKFELSVKVAERYLEKGNSSRVLVTSGNYISQGITRGNYPVLLSGTNYLPDEPRKFLFENPDHGISTAIMIGNEMTNVGKEIRDYNITRENRTTNEKISVFIKYGQARGDSGSIYAISLFPLPTGDIELHVPEVRYDPGTGEILITYQNTGESRMYQLTNFEVLSSGDTVAKGGDESPVFVGGQTNRTVSYDVNLTASEYQDAEVEFSTTYGTSPQKLDTYLTEESRFSPPLRKELTIEEIEDDSNMTLQTVDYLKSLGRFRIVVENRAEDPGYAQVRLTGVEIKGQEQSFASEKKSIPGESTGTFYLPAELDQIDIQQNSEVTAVVSHGEKRSSLVRTETSEAELEVVELPWTALAGGAVLLILVAAAVAYRKLDITLEVKR